MVSSSPFHIENTAISCIRSDDEFPARVMMLLYYLEVSIFYPIERTGCNYYFIFFCVTFFLFVFPPSDFLKIIGSNREKAGNGSVTVRVKWLLFSCALIPGKAKRRQPDCSDRHLLYRLFHYAGFGFSGDKKARHFYRAKVALSHITHFITAIFIVSTKRVSILCQFGIMRRGNG